jgi:hypothetical protein
MPIDEVVVAQDTVGPFAETPYAAPVASVAALPAAPPDRTRPAVMAAAGWVYDPAGGAVLSQRADDAMARYGSRIYEWMAKDDQVAASLATLKLGILGAGLHVAPRHEAEPGAADIPPDERAELDLSREVAEFVGRCMLRLERPVRETLSELLDGLAEGSVLAEFVLEVAPDGPDAGQYVPTSLRAKPRAAWAFVVDGYGKVLGILGQTFGGPAVLPRDRFVIFSWKPRRGDPRGQSVLRPAYEPWNLKVQQGPHRARYTANFAAPSVVIKYDASNSGTPVYRPLPDGTDDLSRPPLAPHQQAAMAAEGWSSAAYMAVPNTWEVDVIEPKADGGAFQDADAAWDRRIARAILLAARATNEAEHGSKADSETAFAVMDLLFGDGKEALADCLEDDLFYLLVLLRWGKDIADRHTPRAVLGVNKQVVAALWTAFAALFSKGCVPDALLPRVFVDLLGLPWNDAATEALNAKAAQKQAAAEAQAEQQAQAQQQPSGQVGPPDAEEDQQAEDDQQPPPDEAK